MDRNTVIGLLLIFALFLGFSFYQTSQVRKQQEAQQALIAEENEREEKAAAERLSLDIQSDSLSATTETQSAAMKELPLAQRFSNAQVGEGDYVVETDKAIYYFAKKGGFLKQIELKNIYRYTPKDSAKLPLIMYDGGSDEMAIKLLLRDQTEISN